jgi:hypothetical protein
MCGVPAWAFGLAALLLCWFLSWGARAQPAPAAPGQAPKHAADEVIDVTVEGERPPPARETLTSSEVRALPGAFGDPFRAIDALPGVTPIFSGVPYFYVRGAPPGNVGYFLDGIRVPALFHLALGPGVLHPALVERVDLHPGGYPARYGRYAGGIVAATTRRLEPEWHGEASVRLVDAGAMLQAPLPGDRGAAVVAGRYSYTAAILSAVAPEVSLDYWDYQAAIDVRVGDRDRLGALVFGAFDFLGEDQPDGSTRTSFATEFHRLDLRYEHDLGRGRVRQAVTFGADRTRISDQGFLRDRMIAARTAVELREARDLAFHFGTDAVFDLYDIVPTQPELLTLFPPRRDIAGGGWMEVVAELDPRFELHAGLRLDAFGSAGATAAALDPRLGGRLRLSPSLRLVFAHGIAHQPPSFVIPVPGFQVADLGGGLQRSLQSSAGVEVDLPASFVARATVFRNGFLDMTDAIGQGRFDGDDPETFLRRSLGSAYGLELWLERPLSHTVGGYLAYTLSRSTRSLGAERFVATFDRTHVLSLAVSSKLGRGWRAGSRLYFYTGFVGQLRDDDDDEPPQGFSAPPPEPAPRPRGTERVPPFFRLDARIEKRWLLGDGFWIGVVAEVLNATLGKEPVQLDCDPRGCQVERIGPVTLPSLGVEGGF